MSDLELDTFMSFFIEPLLVLWPYFFIWFKKGGNKFLFVSAFFGILLVTGMLLTAIAFPFGIFFIKIAPQLEASAVGKYIEPLISLSNVVQSWWFIAIFPVLYFVLPFLLYRKYEVFNLTSAGKGRS